MTPKHRSIRFPATEVSRALEGMPHAGTLAHKGTESASAGYGVSTRRGTSFRPEARFQSPTPASRHVHQPVCALDLLHLPIELLLTSGGDTRCVIDPRTGLNAFGCAPCPRPDTLAYGSTTASTISPRAWSAAVAAHDALLGSARSDAAIDQAVEALRADILDALGLAATGADLVFAPSGTDATLLALFLARTFAEFRPVDCVLVGGDDTGSGVPRAAAGQHFAAATARGICVTAGQPVAGLADGATLGSIPMRDACGIERALDEVDAEVLTLAERALAAGRQAVVFAVDSSKTGARLPSTACLETLDHRHGRAVRVVVDACQMRISRARVRWHLERGRLVVITGSKFFTGPAFSGAVLTPPLSGGYAARTRLSHVPTGLTDYSLASDWPLAAHWSVGIRRALPQGINLGQYLRWAAALEEMRAWFAVPAAFRYATLEHLATEVERSASQRDGIELAREGRPIERMDGEMSVRTVFPLVLRPAGVTLAHADAMRVYRAMQGLCDTEYVIGGPPVEIGQPVRVAAAHGDVGLLRIASSARLVTDAWERVAGSAGGPPATSDAQPAWLRSPAGGLKWAGRHSADSPCPPEGGTAAGRSRAGSPFRGTGGDLEDPYASATAGDVQTVLDSIEAACDAVTRNSHEEAMIAA